MSLVPVDPTSEASVLTLLERAHEWLAEAVHRGEPGDIAMVKAQMATAAEATKQLNLSKDIQLDAQEMVRRAEYALGKAIRRGQAEGVIASKSQMASYAGHVSAGQRLGLSQSLDRPVKPSDFATESELMGARGDGIYALADNAEPEEFETALDEAKEEGNLSRANVVRKIKIKGQPNPGVITRDMRADLIQTLAEQGYSSRQMPDRVGVTEETVRQIAREFGVEIPADKVIVGTRRINHTQVVENVITGVQNTVASLAYVDLNEVDFKEVDEWVASLTASIAALNRFKKQIKETTHV